MRVCLNCRHFELAVAQQCSETRAEPVAEKDRANFCDWFDFARRAYAPREGGDPASNARAQFRKLFGD